MIHRLRFIQRKRDGRDDRAWIRFQDEMPSPDARTIVLSTCERVAAITVEPVIDATSGQQAQLRWTGEAAAMAVLRIAAGLDSRIVGETAILGQLRRAWGDARAIGPLDPMLDQLGVRAMRAGKLARATGGFAERDHGYAAAAVDALATLRAIARKPELRIAVAGTGALAVEFARIAASRSLGVVAYSRHPGSVDPGTRLQFQAVRSLCELSSDLTELDVVVAATRSPAPIISVDDVPARRSPLLLIDLGASPAFVGEARAGVERIDLDQLVGESPRASAIAHAEAVCARQFAIFLERLSTKRCFEEAGL